MAHAIDNYTNLIDFSDYARRTPRLGLFALLAQKRADRRAYVALVRELEAHSDRELADIGISRLNIRDLARESIYGA
ncbi:MAG: DUF1127 domain-containing protein [Amaricoccus sp.]